MRRIIRIIFLMGIIILSMFSCEDKEELPTNHAQGQVVDFFGQCYGEFIMIEVYRPKGIGAPGRFMRGDEEIVYLNAVGVPHFHRLENIPDTIHLHRGSFIYFKYREVKNDELYLFSPEKPMACPANICPPAVKLYIITEVIGYL